MDPETADTVVKVIAAIALTAWLVSLWFTETSFRWRPAAGDGDAFSMQDKRNGAFTGVQTVDASPEAILTRAAHALATNRQPELGQVKITERTDQTLLFERVIARQAGFDWARLRVTPVALGKARIEYEMAPYNGRSLRIAAALLQIAGIVLLGALFVFMQQVVIDHAKPAIRAQAFQMVQVGHLLWPPFLIAASYRRRVQTAWASFEAFVNNLSHYSPADVPQPAPVYR